MIYCLCSYIPSQVSTQWLTGIHTADSLIMCWVGLQYPDRKGNQFTVEFHLVSLQFRKVLEYILGFQSGIPISFSCTVAWGRCWNPSILSGIPPDFSNSKRVSMTNGSSTLNVLHDNNLQSNLCCSIRLTGSLLGTPMIRWQPGKAVVASSVQIVPTHFLLGCWHVHGKLPEWVPKETNAVQIDLAGRGRMVEVAQNKVNTFWIFGAKNLERWKTGEECKMSSHNVCSLQSSLLAQRLRRLQRLHGVCGRCTWTCEKIAAVSFRKRFQVIWRTKGGKKINEKKTSHATKIKELLRNFKFSVQDSVRTQAYTRTHAASGTAEQLQPSLCA